MQLLLHGDTLMSPFTRAAIDTADEMPEKVIDPRWNHPVSSGDIHNLARDIDARLDTIERLQRLGGVQIVLILLGVIALVIERFI